MWLLTVLFVLESTVLQAWQYSLPLDNVKL